MNVIMDLCIVPIGVDVSVSKAASRNCSRYPTGTLFSPPLRGISTMVTSATI